MQVRYIAALIALLLIGALPFSGGMIGNVTILDTEPIPENPSLKTSTSWTTYGTDTGMEGKIQTRVTNTGNETVYVKLQVTPVDKYNVYHNRHTLGPREIRPGETEIYTDEWTRDDQNQRNWKEAHVQVEVCEGKLIGGKCRVYGLVDNE